MPTIRQFLIPVACLMGFVQGVTLAVEPVDYLSQVKPLLKTRCYACHGGLKQEAGLRLDTVEFMRTGGDSGTVLNDDAASSRSSLIIQRVSSTDDVDRMPPLHEGEQFKPDEIELLRRWIEAGAPGPEDEEPEADARNHWSFLPIKRPELPTDRNLNWEKNPIDAWIAAGHRQQGLTPSKEASRSVLLRRLSIDLIGLPPTVDELAAAEADQSPDWYEKTVDRLLADPRYGERWARHWMDIWRYSDTWGLRGTQRNSSAHMWHFRDWIVESLNADRPYDEMIRLMLAADEIAPEDPSELRATGFLVRNYYTFNRNQWMDETVEHVSKGLLGLTMNCSKCHDHKYDPIQQVDYYKMRAFFEPYLTRLDLVPGEADIQKDGIPRVFDGLLEQPTFLLIRGDDSRPDQSNPIAPGVPEILKFAELDIVPVSLPVTSYEPARRPWVLDSHLQAARQNLKAAQEKLEKVTLDAQKAAASQNVTSPGPKPSTPTDASPAAKTDSPNNVPPAVALAQADLAIAEAKLSSVEKRAIAMRAGWQEPVPNELLQLNRDAILAERATAVAESRKAVLTAEQALAKAAKDKKEPAEKKLTEARTQLEKVTTALSAEIKETDKFTPLPGAVWTATRFKFTGEDDPDVPFPAQSSGRRLALAKWITDQRNPLTARVAVNHLWNRHFGAPLAPTPFDLGRANANPTHPELIDWLASEFMDQGWSMKHLHRLIVTSATYRMASTLAAAEANLAIDPDNRYWWRRIPIRVESQVVRDSVLAIAGTLDPAIGGPAVPPKEQDKSTRRSIYFYHSSIEQSLFLVTFNEANVKECYQRERSVVPQQALALTNSGLILDASQKIADRIRQTAPQDSDFVVQAFLQILGYTPNADELETAMQALDDLKKVPDSSSELAQSQLVWVLLNHNDFVTLR